MGRGNKNGGPGGGGGDTGGGNLTILGTNGADRLKGGSGDDTLTGYGGDDQIDGGDGLDLAIYEGGIEGYQISFGKRGTIIVTDIDPSDGNDGTDTLKNIEKIQFGNYTYDTSGSNPMAIVGDDVVRVYEGGSAVYSFEVLNPDGGALWHRVQQTNVDWYSLYTREHAQLNADNTYLTAAWNITGVPFVYDSLAEGEIKIETFEVLVGPSYDNYTASKTVTVEIVGTNDAPEMDDGTLVALEDGGPAAASLAPLGSDIDSDDDGASLTYRIVDAPAGFQTWIDGTTLWFDPGAAFQELQRTDSVKLYATVEAVDAHGAVSNTAQIEITVNGANDPLPDYLNADGSIDYAALGVSTAVANRGIIDGFAADAWLLDFAAGTAGDDIRIARAERVLSLDDNTFFGYQDTTVHLGDGDDILAFLLDGAQASLGGFSGVYVNTGNGNDVVAIDGAAVTGSFYINVTEIRTGDGQDQVLVDLDTEANGWIDDFRHGLDIDTGNDNDFVSIVRRDSDGGENSQFMGSVQTGSDDDIFEFEWSVGSTKNGFVDIFFAAGYGNDIARIDTSGTTGDGSPDAKTGLYGSIGMEQGDDTLYLNLGDPVEDDAYAWVTGGDHPYYQAGYDVLHLEMGNIADFTVTALDTGIGIPQYEVEWQGQTLRLSGWEEVWANDGLLIDDRPPDMLA